MSTGNATNSTHANESAGPIRAQRLSRLGRESSRRSGGSNESVTGRVCMHVLPADSETQRSLFLQQREQSQELTSQRQERAIGSIEAHHFRKFHALFGRYARTDCLEAIFVVILRAAVDGPADRAARGSVSRLGVTWMWQPRKRRTYRGRP